MVSLSNLAGQRNINTMITQENRFKLWKIIRRIAYKNSTIIPDFVYDEYNDYMKVIEGNIRFMVIEHYNLDSIFTYKAYEEKDLKSTKDKERMAEIFEDFFSDSSKGWNTVLLIDLKTMKAYYLSKDIIEDKKTKIQKVKYLKKLI